VIIVANDQLRPLVATAVRKFVHDWDEHARANGGTPIRAGLRRDALDLAEALHPREGVTVTVELARLARKRRLAAARAKRYRQRKKMRDECGQRSA
jgi:hypothetical protein